MDIRTKQKTYSVLHNMKRTAEVFGKLVKESAKNPGRVARKLTAGYVKDPITSTANVAANMTPIPGIGKLALASTPMVSSASSKVIPRKARRVLRRTSRNIMSESGATKASRLGQKIEYHTNKGLLNLSQLSKYLPM